MTKNPYLNALWAAVYISLVATLMHYGQSLPFANKPDTVFAPMAMISLLTFSVAVMGYLFAMRPIQMYLDGEKREAVNFFVRTLSTFGVITVIFFLSLIFLS